MFRDWIARQCERLQVLPQVCDNLIGTVIEVRQGYKSKDSKRQNADIANAATAYRQAYLPCVMLLTAQIDGDVLTRYARMLTSFYASY